MSKEDRLDAEFVRKILDYNPISGILTWKYRYDCPPEWNTKWAGKEAGAKHPDCHRFLSINNTRYKSHRIIWFMVTGKWPVGIDHINGIRDDNRWDNLREANQLQNMQNQCIRSNNTSGYPGV